LNSHVSCLKYGPQCLGRKEFKSEKETVFIPARVKRPQYKRKKEGSARKTCIHRDLKIDYREKKKLHKKG
jgi:hypothetical protein